MRRSFIRAVGLPILFLSLVFVAVPRAQSATGTIILDVFEAEAFARNTDFAGIVPWMWRQDFFVNASVSTTSGTSLPPSLDQRDLAAWQPFSVSATIDRDTVIVPVHVELWDKDDVTADDQFDINPTPAVRALDLFFNTCTMRFSGTGIPESGPGRALLPFGTEDDAGRVALQIRTADGRPFVPNNVVMTQAGPVQAVYGAHAMVEQKGTAFRVDFASSWTTPRNATVTVTMSDGFTTVSHTKDVTIPPNGLPVFFFDNSPNTVGGTEPPFFPVKDRFDPRLTWQVSAVIDGEGPDVSPPPPPFSNCRVDADNGLSGAVPMVTTNSPTTVYLRWDWANPVLGVVPDFPSVAATNATFDSNERLRRAIFPIADVRSAIFPIEVPAPYVDPLLEPARTLFLWDVAARVIGIERLVLLTRNGWFRENGEAGRLMFATGAIGMSLGEFAPHAVFAEAGFSQVVVHEHGHTYALSQHTCSTGGVIEDTLGLGCRDEYTHAASDGRPYQGSGFDVLGEIYPTGFGGVPGTRDVKATNFMDTTGAPDGTFDRWIDTFSYNVLLDQMRLIEDPPLVSLGGMVRVPGGFDAPSGAPEGQLMTSYRFDGVPDREQAKLDEPSGDGPFMVKLVTNTTTGSGYEYRFTPEFNLEGDDTEGVGFFSFAVPWVEGVQRIELYGPSQPDKPEQSQDVLINTRPISAKALVVSALTAEIDPQNTVRIHWDVADSDTPSDQLRTMLYVHPTEAKGDYDGFVPIAVDVSGTEFSIPARSFATLPGVYDARIVVSDGVNTATFDQPKLFDIQPDVFLPSVQR